ncbi:aminoglycoside phosphotransferase family protein [Microbacterium sp. M1A1_1b]
MSSETFRLPEGLVRATTDREGATGNAWLAELPAIVARLLNAWDCQADGAPTHGEVALVLPVRRGDEPAALKVSYPHPGNRSEPHALRTFDGRGAVRVHEADDDVCGMLLERAGPETLASVASADQAIEIQGDLARRLAVPAPPTAPALADTTDGWLDELDRQTAALPGVVPDAALDRARDTIRALASDTTTTMLHGDLHVGNVLRADREPWLAIDPKGWRGTAAYDAFTVVAVRAGDLLETADPERAFVDRVRRFAGAAGVDAELALACVQARATSSLLYERLHRGSWFAMLERLVQLGV